MARPASGTPATVALDRAGVPYTLHAYDLGRQAVPGKTGATSYGETVAGAIEADPAQVFKTLVAQVDGRLTVAVVPVAGSLDLKALAAAVGGKRADLAEVAIAERTTGYVIGGISPLGQRTQLPIVVDSTALGFESIFVSAGKRGLQLQLAPADLIRLTKAIVASVARQ